MKHYRIVSNECELEYDQIEETGESNGADSSDQRDCSIEIEEIKSIVKELLQVGTCKSSFTILTNKIRISYTKKTHFSNTTPRQNRKGGSYVY